MRCIYYVVVVSFSDWSWIRKNFSQEHKCVPTKIFVIVYLFLLEKISKCASSCRKKILSAQVVFEIKFLSVYLLLDEKNAKCVCTTGVMCNSSLFWRVCDSEPYNSQFDSMPLLNSSLEIVFLFFVLAIFQSCNKVKSY